MTVMGEGTLRPVVALHKKEYIITETDTYRLDTTIYYTYHAETYCHYGEVLDCSLVLVDCTVVVVPTEVGSKALLIVLAKLDGNKPIFSKTDNGKTCGVVVLVGFLFAAASGFNLLSSLQISIT